MPCVFASTDDGTDKSALELLAEVLLAHDVEFVVVGGQAEVLLSRATRRGRGDLDRAETYRVGDLEPKVIRLEDLITIKEHIRRPKDRDSLLQPYTIRRLRGSP